MTNGFYLQNFLYLYSRNKHVIMENTRIKLSETVMVIDAAYLNFVINDLKKYFEPLLGRSLQRADLALFTMCLAMDAGVKEGSNDVQILLVYTHGEYFGLGKKIGKFGWSVEKKKKKNKK